MLVPYSWLQEYLDYDFSDTDVYELKDRITSIGPEVAQVIQTGINKENAGNIILTVVDEISGIENSDNLFRCRLSKVSGQSTAFYDVVTNSMMLEEKDYVVLALPGTELPDGNTVKVMNIRGTSSNGMLLAKQHLMLEEKSSDIWILGKDKKKAEGLFQTYTLEDYVFDIELTANRSDCLSVIGIAREVSALLGCPMNIPENPVEEDESVELPNITVKDTVGCPRYTSRILEGVKVKPSPDWMKRRLELCGIRPINNIVDVTNYVLLEYGHPTHAFDLDRLDEKRIIIKNAKEGEIFVTLDAQERELDEQTLVIADHNKPVALAGIMGGENSEIIDSTQTVLLESAYFKPDVIRRTAKKLDMMTESSYRFVRDADRGITRKVIDRIAVLLGETTSMKISGLVDKYSNSLFKDVMVNIKASMVSEKLGVAIDIKEIEEFLKLLNFTVMAKRDDAIEVKVPTFRSDVKRAIDVVEELARVYGYDRIPSNRYRPQPNVTALINTMNISEKIKHLFSGQGFTETFNYSFTNEKELSRVNLGTDDVIYLNNALSNEISILRPDMIVGLMSSLEFNIHNAYVQGLRIYEVGRIFYQENQQTVEKEKVAFVIYGEDNKYADISGISEYILAKLGKRTMRIRKSSAPYYHPVNSAEIYDGETVIGEFGEIHPDISDRLKLKHPCFYGMMDMKVLESVYAEEKGIVPISKYPPTARDLSVVVNDTCYARDMIEEMRRFDPLISEVKFEDIYRDEKIEQGKQSLTFSLTFQSFTSTLKDEDVNAVMNSLIDFLKEEYQAELRSS